MRKRAKLSKAELLNRQIASWERKQEVAVVMLRKSAEMLLKLRKQRQRKLARERAEPAAVEPVAEPVVSIEPPKDDGLDLGPFARRRDATRAAEVQAEVDAVKKRKADKAAEKRAIKKEVVQADLTGKRRKMPLSGKAALDAIRNGN